MIEGRAASVAVDVVRDLLADYSHARVEHCSSCELRLPGAAGGIKQDALFEHPNPGSEPARVTFDLELPSLEAGDLLLLAFDLGLADGARVEGQADGVRFEVAVDGQVRFSREHRATRWESHAVDLTELGGRRVALALLITALRNSNFDWAVWGRPRIFRFSSVEALSSAARGSRTMPVAGGVGVAAVHGLPGTRMRLAATDSKDAMEWVLTEVSEGKGVAGWGVKSFNFAEPGGLALTWSPSNGVDQARIGIFQPKPSLVRLTAGQAVVVAGTPLSLLAEIKNEGLGPLPKGEASVVFQMNQDTLPITAVPGIQPGDSAQVRGVWPTPSQAGKVRLGTRLITQTSTSMVERWLTTVATSSPFDVLENDKLRIKFVQPGNHAAFAKIFARSGQDWVPAGLWSPLFRVRYQGADGPVDWIPEVVQFQGATTVENRPTARLAVKASDPDGIPWQMGLEVSLEPGAAKARLRYTWRADQARSILSLWGPNLYAGHETTGEAKSWGLFPGLEFLFGAERSSNTRDFAPNLADRRTPHFHKITAPLMAVTVGSRSQASPSQSGRFFAPDSLKDRAPLPGDRDSFPELPLNLTLALLWEPHQRWDGQRAFPSARFASPNFDEGMLNHRMGLFIPSCPDWVPENSDLARAPISLATGQTWSLEATLLAVPEPPLAAVREWIRDCGGLPKPPPWPRTFQEELDLCLKGFLETVWDSSQSQWRHCIDWGSQHAPGFAALVWWVSHVSDRPSSRQRAANRVALVGDRMLAEAGPGQLLSSAACHIMRWEFPFYFGHLAEAMPALEPQIQHWIRTQHPDGSWRYHAGNAEQAELGAPGDSVLGTCASQAAAILRYARITGDVSAWAAGQKALEFMESFRVPRGGQTWECPMYEPDILAAAYALSAFLDAYRISEDPRWLAHAEYWAETGVPFQYLWTLPDKPMMLGASIPVFGSTFYTHTWLAVPVQWCGLVYAYYVRQLAAELEHRPGPRAASGAPAVPLALHFTPADWRRMSELITVSATYQQFSEGPKAGAYPDSISRFERRNPAFLNPEDILVNVLALHGFDPDIKTQRVRTAEGEVVASSGAAVEGLRRDGNALEFSLRYFKDQISHTLITGRRPKTVFVEETPLVESVEPLKRQVGWWWDSQRQRLYLAVTHSQERLPVRVAFP